MPDVTPQSTKVKNRLRESSPAEMEVMLGDETLEFSDIYFKDGLRRDPIYRFSGENVEVHYDSGTQQFAGVNLAHGGRIVLRVQAVEEDRIIVTE